MCQACTPTTQLWYCFQASSSSNALAINAYTQKQQIKKQSRHSMRQKKNYDSRNTPFEKKNIDKNKQNMEQT